VRQVKADKPAVNASRVLSRLTARLNRCGVLTAPIRGTVKNQYYAEQAFVGYRRLPLFVSYYRSWKALDASFSIAVDGRHVRPPCGRGLTARTTKAAFCLASSRE